MTTKTRNEAPRAEESTEAADPMNPFEETPPVDDQALEAPAPEPVVDDPPAEPEQTGPKPGSAEWALDLAANATRKERDADRQHFDHIRQCYMGVLGRMVDEQATEEDARSLTGLLADLEITSERLQDHIRCVKRARRQQALMEDRDAAYERDQKARNEHRAFVKESEKKERELYMAYMNAEAHLGHCTRAPNELRLLGQAYPTLFDNDNPPKLLETFADGVVS